jgi:hypothetical protein
MNHWGELKNKIDLAVVGLQLQNSRRHEGWTVIKDILSSSNIPIIIHTENETRDVWKTVARTKRLRVIAKPASIHHWRSVIVPFFYEIHGAGADEIFELPDGRFSAEELYDRAKPDFFVNGKRVRLKDIYYVVRENKKLTVCCRRGLFTYNASLADFSDHARHHNLIQVNRSTIINWMYVEESNNGNLLLEFPEGNASIPVGRAYSHAVAKRRNDFINRR